MLGLFGMLGLVTVSFTKILVQGTKLCIKLMWHLFTWPFYLIGWLCKQKISKPAARSFSSESHSFRGKALEDMTGLEFEHACAQWLVRQGYHSVAVTPATNDFGADITAVDENNLVWVFQCKLYSTKLDNTPIQEVVASKAHYNADCAGVITNSTFTEAAEQLAAENDVKLISLMSWEI